MSRDNIILTQDRLKELLSYDHETGVFTWRVNRGRTAKAGDVAGRLHHLAYRGIKIDGVEYRAHRLAWLYAHGKWPTKQTDHRNGIRDDNRLDNLRECTNAENQQNRIVQRNSTSGFTGVSWSKKDKKWQAKIKKDRKNYWLGLFFTTEAADQAYREAKRRMHEFNPEIRLGAMS